MMLSEPRTTTCIQHTIRVGTKLKRYRQDEAILQGTTCSRSDTGLNNLFSYKLHAILICVDVPVKNREIKAIGPVNLDVNETWAKLMCTMSVEEPAQKGAKLLT